MRDALDAAWGDFPTNDIGYDWLRYTGNARPPSGWCDLIVQHSRLTFIMETYSTRSQEGFQAGVYDCQFAEQRARAVHPGVASIAVAVSDGNYADYWDAGEYAQGWASAATLHFFPYGTPAICNTFIKGAQYANGFNLAVTWVPETWGQATGLVQVVGFSPVANTDLNRVLAPYYPGGTPAPTPTPPSQEDDSDMISVQMRPGVDSHMWVTSDGQVVFRDYIEGAAGQVVEIKERHGQAYKVTDPKPLVSGPLVCFAADRHEALVTQTGYGPVIDLI